MKNNRMCYYITPYLSATMIIARGDYLSEQYHWKYCLFKVSTPYRDAPRGDSPLPPPLL